VNPSGGSNGNPQISRLYSYNTDFTGDVGSFEFVVYNAGQYTLTAQLDGYNSSIEVFVNNDSAGNTSIANVTLSSYSVPVLSKEQLACAGAVTGVVMGRNGAILPGVNVSLWQNGQLVKIPNNPQLALLGGNRFLFANLSPGHYELIANTMYTSLSSFVDTAYVDMYNNTVTSNITMQNYTYINMTPPSIPPQNPSNTPTPGTVTPNYLPSPSAFPASLYVLLSIGATTLICLRKKSS
jgi:hypothetical protein